jgi:outer membrane immunogenic protein
MKKILLGAVALVTLGTASAVAADLPNRTYTKAAPAYVAPAYNWTGLYVGGHIGAGFNGDSSSGVAGFSNGNNNASFLGGGQIGADYQFAPNWVLGVEGQFTGLTDNRRSFFTPTGNGFRDRDDWLGSVTGRLGYTWGPTLIYAKGGVAFRDNSGVAAFSAPGVPVAFTTNRDDVGYTVGGGLEYMFAPAWSAKVEYQYYNFGNTNVTSALAGLPAPGASYTDDIHTVKLGVNYHFNWGGPSLARY